MKLEIYYPYWGSEGTDYSEFFQRVREAGYDGVELLVDSETPKDRIRSAREATGLKIIAQHAVTTTDRPEEYRRIFESKLQAMVDLEPEFINSQTGQDSFSQDENLELLRFAGDFAAANNITILHETHRGKFSYHPRVTEWYLDRMPELRLSADFSHWCVVTESLLETHRPALEKALSRTDHFHLRVGFAEGPQVNHPAAPEWDEALQRHLEWWDDIVQQNDRKGRDILTCTVEFGPVPYLPTLPFTAKPVADQWQINLFMKEMIEERYADYRGKLSGSSPF